MRRSAIGKLWQALQHGEFAYLSYHLWLRWHRLDHGHASHVAKSDGQSYSNSGGPDLDRVLKTLSIPPESVLLEYGVGKGIAVITFSKYFEHIIGVDLSQVLIETARKNLAKVKVRNATLYCEDARTFVVGLDEVTHLYLFNSFSREVDACVIANLKASLQRRPRDITLIYKAPYAHDLFVQAGFVHQQDLCFRREKRTQDRFSIYILPAVAAVNLETSKSNVGPARRMLTLTAQ